MPLRDQQGWVDHQSPGKEEGQILPKQPFEKRRSSGRSSYFRRHAPRDEYTKTRRWVTDPNSGAEPPIRGLFTALIDSGADELSQQETS